MKLTKIFNTIALCVTLFVIVVVVFSACIPTPVRPMGYTIEGKIKDLIKVWAIMIIVANVLFLPLYISVIISWFNTRENKKFKDTKSYIYTRDLPEYNAALAGMLYDFKADYEQEFVGGVLDLIAKGYIIEKNYRLIVDEEKYFRASLENKLLKSEKYILDLCKSNDSRIKSGVMIDYATELRSDLYDLGFVKQQTSLEKIRDFCMKNFESNTRNFLNRFALLSCFVMFIFLFRIS